MLGNGPALPVDDLDCLAGQFTIGVNRILSSGFTPTAIMWVDGTVYQSDGEQIDASGAMLVCDRSVWNRQFHIGIKTWTGDGALQHCSEPGILCCNGNTGCTAARWALALGFSPVYVVGMSATYRGTGDAQRTDFYGVNTRHHRTEGDGGTLSVMRGELERLRRDFPDDVVPVIDGVMLRAVAATHGPADTQSLRAAITDHLRTLNSVEMR